MDNTIFCVVIENGHIRLYEDTTFDNQLYELYKYGYTHNYRGDKIYTTYTVLYYGTCKHDAEETYMKMAEQDNSYE